MSQRSPLAAPNGSPVPGMPAAVRHLPPAEVTDEFPATDGTRPETPPATVAPRRRFGRKPRTRTPEQLAAWQAERRALATAAAADEDFADVPDADEHLTAAAHAKKLRTLRARNAQTQARGELKRAEHEARAENETAEAAARSRAWHARATAHMHRITDPASRVAMLHRRKTWSGRILDVLIVAGVIWGAFNVRHNLAAGMAWHDPRSIFGLVVEPLASVLLILTMQAQQSSTHGIRYAGRAGSPRWLAVVGFEVALVAALVVMNAGPHFGEPVDRLVMWMTPPLLVAAGVLTKPHLVRHYEQLIAAAMPGEVGRLEGETRAVVDRMIAIELGVRDGRFDTLDDDGLPSVSAAAKTLHARKGIVQQALDALRERHHRMLEQ